MANPSTSGQLDLLLLALLRDSPAHGYGVIERLRARTNGVLDVPEGSVYPALYRLEREGLIASQEAMVAGRKRRVYELTLRGHRALRERVENWMTLVTAVGQVVAGGQAHGNT